MKIAWAVASCRNLFQGSRRHVVAVALLTVAGCISFIGQSTGVHNIFHEATRRPIPFWEEESRLRCIVAAAFSQRRKTLRNTLRDILSVQQLEKLGIASGARAETLSLQQFIAMSKVAGQDRE